ncbi:hypothetical protein M1278_01480 [Candidatus Marsarchaeota archaeon]|nr:hypothetical protein [Candidatus Marsarchaeota archaeon]
MDENKLNLVYFGFDEFNAPKNMAIDEVLKKDAEITGNTYIRFYDFKKPSIILSYSDSRECLRKEAFNEPSIEITRRSSGGKPIYIDNNILAYSIIGSLNKSNKEFESTAKVHKFFGSHIINAINNITKFDIKRINLGDVYSIRIDGKPIAGHAQFPTLSRSFFYHGVLAIGKWDAENINKFLNITKQDYENLKLAPCIKDLFKDNANKININEISAIKIKLADLILKFISNNNYKNIEKNKKASIIKEAELLVKIKYSKPTWLENSSSGIKLKNDSRFCLLYDG